MIFYWCGFQLIQHFLLFVDSRSFESIEKINISNQWLIILPNGSVLKFDNQTKENSILIILSRENKKLPTNWQLNLKSVKKKTRVAFITWNRGFILIEMFFFTFKYSFLGWNIAGRTWNYWVVRQSITRFKWKIKIFP